MIREKLNFRLNFEVVSSIIIKILNFEVSFVPKYNLNKKKWTRFVLLFLALTFIIVPVVSLIVYILVLAN